VARDDVLVESRGKKSAGVGLARNAGKQRLSVRAAPAPNPSKTVWKWVEIERAINIRGRQQS
jgi:hypothetical protein